LRIEVRPPKLPYLITLTPLIYYLAFQSPVGYAQTENQRQIIVGSKLECKQTDGRTDTTDCIIFPVNTVGNKLTLYLLTYFPRCSSATKMDTHCGTVCRFRSNNVDNTCDGRRSTAELGHALYATERLAVSTAQCSRGSASRGSVCDSRYLLSGATT